MAIGQLLMNDQVVATVSDDYEWETEDEDLLFYLQEFHPSAPGGGLPGGFPALASAAEALKGSYVIHVFPEVREDVVY